MSSNFYLEMMTILIAAMERQFEAEHRKGFNKIMIRMMSDKKWGSWMSR